MMVPVIPKPQNVDMRDGKFLLHQNTAISINSDDLKNTAEEITNSLFPKTAVQLSGDKKNNSTIELRVVENLKSSLVPPDRLDEAYMLTVNNETIVIEAVSARGVFYGAMSLIQLINNIEGNSINCLQITDWPQLQIRGISDDISRGQVSTVENFKRIIKFISRYKMNTYMPYMEDMIQFKSYPSIGKGRGALSHDEIKEIIEYADRYYVEVIPVFQTLGHYENILAQEEFLEYAEFPGAASLNVSYEGTYQFLETLLKEVFELFPSKYINMGADESYDVGLGASKHLVEQSGIAEVHAEHYRKVYEICKRYGKEVMMYSDIILNYPEIMELIPKDIMMIDWHYEASFDYASTGIFQSSGFRYCVSPAVWNYVTAFPINSIALPNIENITRSGINNDAAGMINSNWGDYGAETFKELVLYGYAWSAVCSWNLKGSSVNEFSKIYFRDFFGIEDNRLAEIYQVFSDKLNLVTWHDVWRHPALQRRKPSWWEGESSTAAKSYSLKQASDKVRSYINELEDKVSANRDHLKVLLFICDLYSFYASKLECHFYLRQKMRLKDVIEELNRDDADETKLEMERKQIEVTLSKVNLPELLENNLIELKDLKAGYRQIWTTYYKEANLKLIEDKFDRLISYYHEIKSDLAGGALSEPLIAGKWIYCSKWEESYFSKSVFMKEFDLSGDVLKANLHLLGDTYVKLYINDKFVEQVYVRRSLSLFTEYDRIKFMDISEYLRAGKNIIEVDAESFNRDPVAGFNLIAEIETNEDNLTLLSDESWLAKSADGSGSWQNSVSKAYSFEIVAPNFRTGRTGWIER